MKEQRLMPQSGSNGGGGHSGDNEGNPFSPDQNWLLATSTPDSNFMFAVDAETPSHSTGVSVVDHSGTARRGNAFRDASQQFVFDFHQVQLLPAVPASEQSRASVGSSLSNTGGDWRSSFGSTDSALGNLNTGRDTSDRSAGGQTARRNQTAPSSEFSPATSLASRSSRSYTDAEAPRSAPRDYVVHQSAPRPSKASSMNPRSVKTPRTGQVASEQKSHTGSSQLNTMKKMYTGIRTLEVDGDPRRGQAGQSTRGVSLVSSTSGLSSGEIELPKYEVANGDNSRRSLNQENRGAGRTPGVLRSVQGDVTQNDQFTLPPGKGFPIQIGSELFRLSGASIMSDAPSYFSRFFEEQLRQNEDGTGGVRTLYIDRDPATFHDICRHLQGYYVQPKDNSHYVRLFADAQFYSLPRLISQLFESEIFIQIGGRDFQIQRDIFTGPGDKPNYFSLDFAAFFSTPAEIFPGLDTNGLLRPPSIKPANVPDHSADVFADLLHMLRGYPLRIRDKHHRADLLRDARYYHFRGLEQKLIYHEISYNVERQTSEIIVRIEDLKQSGISFVGDASPSDRSPLGGWVHYSRPFVDETSYELIVELGDECTKIDLRSMRAEFFGDTKARISSLFQVVANKMNLPINQPLGLMVSSGGAAALPVSPGNTPLSEERVKIRIDRDAHLILDGAEHDTGAALESNDTEIPDSTFLSLERPFMSSPTPLTPSMTSAQNPTISRPSSARPPPRKRKRLGTLDEFGEWIVKKGQWRLKVQPRVDAAEQEEGRMEIVMVAVKLDAFSGQRGRNAGRGFLTA